MVAGSRADRAPRAGGDEDDDEEVEEEEEEEDGGRRAGRAGSTRPAIGASNQLCPCFVVLLFWSSRARSSHQVFLFVAWNGIAAVLRRLKRSSNISSAGSNTFSSM